MKISKNQTSLLPELYLLASVLFYYISAAVVFNIIAIILFAVIAQQLYFRKSFSGLLIGSLLLLVNVCLILALTSELSEYASFNTSAQKLAFAGFTWIGLNMMAGIMMLKKYSSTKKPELSHSI